MLNNVNNIDIELHIVDNELKSENQIQNKDEIRDGLTTFQLKVPTSLNDFYIGDLYFHKEKKEYVLISFYAANQEETKDVYIESFGYYIIKEIDKNEWMFFYQNITQLENIFDKLEYLCNVYNTNITKLTNILEENLDKQSVYFFLTHVVMNHNKESFIYKANRSLFINYKYLNKHTVDILNIPREGFNNLDNIAIPKILDIILYDEFSFLLGYRPLFYQNVYPQKYSKLNSYKERMTIEKIWMGSLFCLNKKNEYTKKLLKDYSEIKKETKEEDKKHLAKFPDNFDKFFCVFDNEKGTNILINPNNIEEEFVYLSFINLTNKNKYYDEYKLITRDEVYEKEYLKLI